MSISMFMGNIDENEIDVTQFSNMGEMISKQMNAVYPISALFQKAIVESSIGALGLFIVISIGWYLLFLVALSTKYKSINTAIMTHSSKSNYKMRELKTSSATTSLYKKELKRFFSSNVYVLNIGMGAIMAFAMTIAIFVLKPEKLEEMLQVSNLENILIKIIAFVFSAVIAMSCTTSVALSLEGKNLWILKSLPLKTMTIMNSKILVNLTITIPIDLIFGVLMNLKFQTDIVTRIMLFVTPIVYSVFVAVWGMFINIKFPNFEWESETAVIKQGMASMIGMLGGAAFGVVPIGIILILQQYPYQLIQIITTAVFFVISVLLYKSVCKYRI
jgi:ABC-2 type transport system permease protein